MDFKTNFIFALFFVILSSSSVKSDDCPIAIEEGCNKSNLRCCPCPTYESERCPIEEEQKCIEKHYHCCINKTISAYECCTNDKFFDLLPKLSDSVAQPRGVLGSLAKMVFTVIGVAIFVIVVCVVCCCCCPFCLWSKNYKGRVIRRNDGQPEQN